MKISIKIDDILNSSLEDLIKNDISNNLLDDSLNLFSDKASRKLLLSNKLNEIITNYVKNIDNLNDNSDFKLEYRFLKEFENTSDEIYNSYNNSNLENLFLFSSRGSFPFLYSFSGFSNPINFNKINMKIMPTIFSVRHLYGVTRNNGELNPRIVDNFLKISYENISENISNLVEKNETEDTIISDFDEVITGFNLKHRMKIYSQLKIKSPFHLVSYIDDNGMKLNRSDFNKTRSFHEKEIGDKIIHHQKRIGSTPWSDDDVFYDKIGLRYPKIGLIDINFLSNLIKSQEIPNFLETYLTNYNQLISEKIGLKKSLKYSFVIDNWTYEILVNSEEPNLFKNQGFRKETLENLVIVDSKQIGELENQDLIIQTSLESFINTYNRTIISEIKQERDFSKTFISNSNTVMLETKNNQIPIINIDNNKNPYQLIFISEGINVLKYLEERYIEKNI